MIIKKEMFYIAKGYFKGFSNEYIINGDTTTIYIYNKDKIKYEVLIDTEDLQKLIDLDLPVHLWWDQKGECYYARLMHCYYKEDGKYTRDTIYLHRFVTNATKEYVVDHKEGKNKLDNRKTNLRVTIHHKNSSNRKGSNINNKSGYRNVFWNTQKGKWTVTICKKYKSIHIGDFDDVHEAGRAAKAAREKYFNDYAGKG